MPYPKVLGLFDGAENGCSYYRLIAPFAQLRGMGYDYAWLPVGGKNKETGQEHGWVSTPSGWYAPQYLAGKGFGVATLLRPMIVAETEHGKDVPSEEFVGLLIEQQHSAGAVFGGDLDDDMWSVAEHNPAKKALLDCTPEAIARTLAQMDFVTTSTPFLARRIVEESGADPERITVVPNLIDFDLFDREDWELDDPNTPGQKVTLSMREVRRQRLMESPNRPLVIGLQGGPSHVEDWKMVAPALANIAKRYGNRVKFIVGGFHPDYLKEALAEADAAGQVWWKGWMPFVEHAETVMSFDINLCPLLPTLFNQSKSAIKWMEGAAAGAATVASKTVYQEYIQGGVTGLLVNDDPAEWEQAIAHLIEKQQHRQDMARLAHTLVRAEFSLSARCYEWTYAYAAAHQRGRANVKKAYMLAQEKKELTRQQQAVAVPV
jgi:glycosyltransferase involved in cell wall biosynthesis